MAETLPILVVGAGPAGLVLSIALLNNGIPIRVIDQSLQFHGGARGTAITPRTLEAFNLLGVVEDVFEISTPPLLMATYGPDGNLMGTREWSQNADTSPNIPFPSVASASQAELERVLRQQLQALGGEIEIGTRLVGLEQDNKVATARVSKHVAVASASSEVEETILCSFVVGCDGARGSTRKLSGIPFLGETKQADRILTANAFVSGADRDCWNFWGQLTTAAIGLKPLKPAPLFQLQSLGPALPDVLPTDLEGISTLFKSISNRDDIVIHDVQWVSEWRANIRMAETFRANRVFLVGDAAHCHSPLGGQGMNTSVQDSMNLAWKLSLAHRGLAGKDLLDSYVTERMPVIAEMLNLSSDLHRQAFRQPSGSALQTEAPEAVDRALYRPKSLLQLGVNYRWSPVVADERFEIAESSAETNPYGVSGGNIDVRAGDRAPDAPVLAIEPTGPRQTTLFRLFDVRRHTILVFASFPIDDERKDELRSASEHLRAKYAASGLASLVIVFPQTTSTADAALYSVGARQASSEASEIHTLIDMEGYAGAGYNIPPETDKTTFVAVRPDGMIGAFALNAAGVDDYFASIVG